MSDTNKQDALMLLAEKANECEALRDRLIAAGLELPRGLPGDPDIDRLIEMVQSHYPRLEPLRDEVDPRGNFIRAMHYVLQGADRRSTLNTEYSFNLHVDNANEVARPLPFRPHQRPGARRRWRSSPAGIAHSDPTDLPFAEVGIGAGGPRRTPATTWRQVISNGLPEAAAARSAAGAGAEPGAGDENFSNAPLQDSTGERRCHCSAGLVGAVLSATVATAPAAGATPGSRPRVITLSAHSKGRGGWLFGLQTSKV